MLRRRPHRFFVARAVGTYTVVVGLAVVGALVAFAVVTDALMVAAAATVVAAAVVAAREVEAAVEGQGSDGARHTPYCDPG